MKRILMTTCLVMFGLSAFANEEVNSRVFLVVKNAATEDFFVERAPVLGCTGLQKGTQLLQLTSEYKVNSNLACGGEVSQTNINYLTCASVTDSTVTDEGEVAALTLDISKCADKDNEQLTETIKKVARLNFSKAVKLTITK